MVQIQVEKVDDPTHGHAWEDVTTVVVPAKTKRQTVIARAVQNSSLKGDLEAGPAVIRVIPAEHAEPIKVEMEQPPPQLKIG